MAQYSAPPTADNKLQNTNPALETKQPVSTKSPQSCATKDTFADQESLLSGELNTESTRIDTAKNDDAFPLVSILWRQLEELRTMQENNRRELDVLKKDMDEFVKEGIQFRQRHHLGEYMFHSDDECSSSDYCVDCISYDDLIRSDIDNDSSVKIGCDENDDRHDYLHVYDIERDDDTDVSEQGAYLEEDKENLGGNEYKNERAQFWLHHEEIDLHDRDYDDDSDEYSETDDYINYWNHSFTTNESYHDRYHSLGGDDDTGILEQEVYLEENKENIGNCIHPSRW